MLVVSGNSGMGLAQGTDGQQYQVKLYGTGEIESFTIEIKPTGSPATPLLK